MKQSTRIDSSRQVIKARSIGAQVGPMLAGSTRWRIAQVYRHCFYCLSDIGNVICIGDARIDRGPFTIICDDSAVTTVATFNKNRVIRSCHDAMLLDDWTVIDTARAVPWLAGFNTCAGPGAVPARVLSTLAETAASTAPQQSFGALIPTLFTPEHRDQKASATTTFLHRRLLQIVDSVHHEGAFNEPVRLAALLTPLIGLGYGLTPSGDDFCAGFVLSLVAGGKTEQAARLAAELFQAARSRTTAISLAFYRALAGSRLCESQTRLLHCCAAQQKSDGDLVDALHDFQSRKRNFGGVR